MTIFKIFNKINRENILPKDNIHRVMKDQENKWVWYSEVSKYLIPFKVEGKLLLR